jgi:hypothetical protein
MLLLLRLPHPRLNAANSEHGQAHWPQFRGPNAQGVVQTEMKLPTLFGPSKNVI